MKEVKKNIHGLMGMNEVSDMVNDQKKNGSNELGNNQDNAFGGDLGGDDLMAFDFDSTPGGYNKGGFPDESGSLLN